MIFEKPLSKFNLGIITIPTIAGIGLLLIGLIAGVSLVTQNQILKSKAAVGEGPKNINLVNISSTSTSIYWQTDEATTGFIQVQTPSGQKKTYLDERDLNGPQPHKFHFATLTNLEPSTTYSYQIYSGSTTYPDTPATLKTSSQTPTNDWAPIVGTVVDTNNQPIGEALVFLEINGVSKLATITKNGGNFILSLSSINLEDLEEFSKNNDGSYQAKLIVQGPVNKTEAAISLPQKDTASNPLVIKNVSSTLVLPTPQPTSSTAKTSTSSAKIVKYELNGDGKIDATDLSIILRNFGTSSKNPKADLNFDGIIDQKDANLIIVYLQ